MKCPECSKTGFNDPRHLGRHRRFAHNVIGKKHFKKDGVTPVKGFKPPVANGLKCPECGEVFDNNRNLGYHRRIAHGIPGKTAKYNTREKNEIRKLRRQQTAIVVAEPEPINTLSPGGFEIPYISYIVGRLEQKCIEEAYNNNLPAKPLVQDVAEYFLAKIRSGG